MEITLLRHLPSLGTKLIGGGSGGADVCKGLMTQVKLKLDLDWFLAIHCFSHKLELAINGSFGHLFDYVNQMIYRKVLYLHGTVPYLSQLNNVQLSLQISKIKAQMFIRTNTF